MKCFAPLPSSTALALRCSGTAALVAGAPVSLRCGAPLRRSGIQAHKESLLSAAYRSLLAAHRWPCGLSVGGAQRGGGLQSLCALGARRPARGWTTWRVAPASWYGASLVPLLALRLRSMPKTRTKVLIPSIPYRLYLGAALSSFACCEVALQAVSWPIDEKGPCESQAYDWSSRRENVQIARVVPSRARSDVIVALRGSESHKERFYNYCSQTPLVLGGMTGVRAAGGAWR
jgi:hypothetical protein